MITCHSQNYSSLAFCILGFLAGIFTVGFGLDLSAKIGCGLALVVGAGLVIPLVVASFSPGLIRWQGMGAACRIEQCWMIRPSIVTHIYVSTIFYYASFNLEAVVTTNPFGAPVGSPIITIASLRVNKKWYRSKLRHKKVNFLDSCTLYDTVSIAHLDCGEMGRSNRSDKLVHYWMWCIFGAYNAHSRTRVTLVGRSHLVANADVRRNADRLACVLVGGCPLPDASFSMIC